MEKAYPTVLPGPSARTIVLNGIAVTVYGLEELSASTTEVACVWLLHPRLCTQAYMQPIAASLIKHWHENFYSPKHRSRLLRRGLIAISFDQRNHGTRERDSLCNLTWADGNPNHAVDMYTIYQGTAADLSILIDKLNDYLKSQHLIEMSLHIVVGISLGGHAAWHCLLHVPDICGGVVIIGCPDYLRLMIERAQQSDIPILTSHTGKRQLNPEYFPQYLLDAIAQSDPAALLTGHNKSSDIEFKEYNAAIEVESSRLQQMRKLRGKKILSISGGADKLVPYSCVQPFLAWLQQAVSKEGCLSNDGISLRLVLEKDTGHEMTPNAAVEVTRFVTEILTEDHQDNSIISRI